MAISNKMMVINNVYMDYLITRRAIFALLVISLFCLNGYAQNNKAEVSETASEFTIGNSLVELTFPKASAFDIKSIRMGGMSLLSATGVNTAPWVLTHNGVKGENPD